MELKNVFKKAESNKRLPDGVSIQPREPDTEALRKAPKLWLGNNAQLTAFNNVFSLYIPRGELFFIRSVRNYKDQIKDPELKAMVVAFMQQETLHSKAHDAFNESFKLHGFDVDGELEYIYKIFDRVEKYVPKIIQLGMTVFFEHITATMAAGAFEGQLAGEIDPEVHAFNLWHAAEELEHKNVAFDVFKEVGGGYLTRALSGFVAPLIMFPFVRRSMKRMLKVYNEPATEDNKRQFKIVEAAKERQALVIKKFYSPSFHPWNQDDRGILNQWYERFNVSGEVASHSL